MPFKNTRTQNQLKRLGFGRGMRHIFWLFRPENPFSKNNRLDIKKTIEFLQSYFYRHSKIVPRNHFWYLAVKHLIKQSPKNVDIRIESQNLGPKR